MRSAFQLLPAVAVIATVTSLSARTLDVRPHGTLSTLSAAAAHAQPGDTILFHAGTYPGGQFVSGLAGRADAWITIMAAPGDEVILQGATTAWQLSDPAWVRIEGFVIQGQTGNGLNIDDAGTFDTPAHDIVIARCEWRGLDANGNNDELKLSGVDNFEVRDCSFRDGAAGGSMIDMVGCHAGTISASRFEHAGANCIQVKGGSQNIRIERNTFIDGGGRALNIGGSTDPAYFRPQGSTFEADDITVYSNFFLGSEAPVAFVGAVHSVVANNTFYLPKRWALRILQETTLPGFAQCGENTVRDNIFVVAGGVGTTAINIGPQTRPGTFLFEGNLWFNLEDARWTGPNLPTTESGGMVGRNPMLTSPPIDITPLHGSAAIGAGTAHATEPALDMLGRPFARPRSIGAVEGNSASSVQASAEAPSAISFAVLGGGRLTVANAAAATDIEIYDLRGGLAARETVAPASGAALDVALPQLTPGTYLCLALRAGHVLGTGMVVWR